SGLSLSLGVLVRDRHTAEERFARVKVPEVLPRWVPVGTRGSLVPLEEVIRHFASWLFPGMQILEPIVFRVARDADFEVAHEADDLLESVESELRRRRFGDAVRLEISSTVSDALLERLEDGLGVDGSQVYRIDGLLDMADLSRIADIDRPD